MRAGILCVNQYAKIVGIFLNDIPLRTKGVPERMCAVKLGVKKGLYL
jgi:hypothetical protein